MDTKTWTREKLFDLVWSVPLTTICNEHGWKLSWLQKICRDHSIPLPTNGHWSKLRFGKADPKPALPAGEEPQSEFTLEPPESLRQMSEGISIKKSEAASWKLPARLTAPHPLIEAAQASFAKHGHEYRGSGLWWPGRDIVDIRVSKAYITRSLVIMDMIIKQLNAAGWEVVLRNGETKAEKRGVSLRIALRETTKKVKSTKSWMSHDYEPTGKLVFRFDGYTRSECRISDPFDPEPLLRVLARMEAIVVDLNTTWEKNRIREAQREAIIQAERDEVARQQKELDDFKKLLNEARRWQEAEMIRKYINASSEKDDAWRNWAMKKADWYDPLKNTADDLLANTDKDNLLLTPQ